MIDCPDWSEDIPPARVAEFTIQLANVYRVVAEDAGKEILNVDTPRIWHRDLFRSFVPLDYYAGNYRQEDRRHICLGVNVQVGGIQGVPFASVPYEMRTLAERIRASLTHAEVLWPTLTKSDRARQLALILAAAIGEFIRIHPFVNGNGRISRLIWCWGLLRFGVPTQCRIHPRPNYPYSHVMQSSMQGDDGPLALLILQHLANFPPTVT